MFPTWCQRANRRLDMLAARTTRLTTKGNSTGVKQYLWLVSKTKKKILCLKQFEGYRVWHKDMCNRMGVGL